MIPQYIIQQWKKQAPWQSDFQVEQDLVLSRALISLYSEPVIRENLAFRGGTALNKIFARPPARYSEDLDFVLINDAPIGETLSTIRSSLDPWLGKARWDQTQKFVKLYYRLHSENSPPIPMRVKIEINAYEIFSVYGYHSYPLAIENEWFTGSAELTSYSIDELMATKFRALYQRSKGRDLFDLWYALVNLKISPEKLLTAFGTYNKKNTQSITRAQFEKNLWNKKNDSQFCTDINALLPMNYNWDINEAFKMIQQILVTKLPGQAWKGNHTSDKPLATGD